MAGVPQVALVGGQLFGGGGHQHLVGGLLQAAGRAAQFPAQARGGGVDAFGVGEQLAAQAYQLHGGGLVGAEGRAAGR